MRIIGGNARGRRLKPAKGQAVRPTSARVKEALFDILPRDLCGAKILDLFAGTGNVSIEAISRGASEAILIDSSIQSGKVIRENLRRLRFANCTRVWIVPVSRALRMLARRGESFDIIFLDPPYERGWVGATLKVIAQGSLLRTTGVLIVEHSVREDVTSRRGTLALVDQRDYGDTRLSFFKYSAETTSAD